MLIRNEDSELWASGQRESCDAAHYEPHFAANSARSCGEILDMNWGVIGLVQNGSGTARHDFCKFISFCRVIHSTPSSQLARRTRLRLLLCRDDGRLVKKVRCLQSRIFFVRSDSGDNNSLKNEEPGALNGPQERGGRAQEHDWTGSGCTSPKV